MRLGLNREARAAALHRMVFRLHFYAGLAVAPFVVILALTGAIYLFNTEIEDAMHPSWRFVHQDGPHEPPERIAEAAAMAYPDARITRIDLPTAANRTAIVFLTPDGGEPFRVYVDPVPAEVRGSFIYKNTLVGFSDVMHGSLMLGDFGDGVVELAACWTIFLVGAGLYLWLPRKQQITGPANGRAFWRSIHGTAGLWVSAGLLFLLLTGLPWASNWGAGLERVMAATGLGYPASYRTHTSHAMHSAPAPAQTLAQANPGVPWTMKPAPAPHSMHGGQAPLTIGPVTRIIAREGLTTAYRLSYPKDAHDVWTAYTYPDQPEGQRTLHIDQYSGEVINDVRYADYGAGAKAVELGVALHMGNYFGVPNQLLMLIATLGAALLALTGPVMWLKRRKRGLGAPAPAEGAGVAWGLVAILAVMGVIFPLMGASILAVLALERIALARLPGVRTWLGLAPARQAA